MKNGLRLLALLGSLETLAAGPVTHQPLAIRPDDLLGADAQPMTAEGKPLPPPPAADQR